MTEGTAGGAPLRIALLAKKGGVGKSTLALLLHEALRRASKAAAIQDWDAQGTSNKALEMIGGRKAGMDAACDVLLFDTPPNLEHVATAAAVRQADLVLVVTTPPPPISGRPTRRRGSPARKIPPPTCGWCSTRCAAAPRSAAWSRRAPPTSARRRWRPSSAPGNATSTRSARDGRRSTAWRARRCWNWPWRCWPAAARREIARGFGRPCDR